MSSSSVDSPSLNSDLKFDALAVLVAFGVAGFLAVCFWRLYRLTVSARPQDMLPVTSSLAAGSGAGKNAAAAAALRQSDISALPVFVHGNGSGGGGAPGVECAVCLAEMKDGERGRFLPGCGHRFHVECIDRWFRANSTCPLCRVAAFGFGEPSAVDPANKGGSVAAPVVPTQA